MQELTYTILTDGSSDRALMNIISWLFDELAPQVPVQKQYADLSRIPDPPKDLFNRIKKAVELYPCNILFVHRDAEKSDLATYEKRVREIQEHFSRASISESKTNLVKIIPVRMMETWFLIDEKAIRTASGNRKNSIHLSLPDIKNLENIANPKELLHNLIKQASGYRGRRLDRLNIGFAVHLIAENISDYRPLRNLPAFANFEAELKAVLMELIAFG